MLKLLEGSQAIAQAVGHCRPQVVPAYPITPQTHIVEALGRLIRQGTLSGARFITVESEFAAMSAAIGASAVGCRTYTATASQGLLYMAEALYNASGLGFPIVMTVANRAIGAPINIFNDHSDSMSQRDCGWIQLYAEDNQAAVDLHVLAFALAERLSVPVMVCVDGFVLTHAFEPIEVPEQADVDRFLPRWQPRQRLTPDAPVTIGAMVGPEAFTEVKYLAHLQLMRALDSFDELSGNYAELVGRTVPALSTHRLDGAETVIIALGSVTGTLRAAADELAARGQSVGIIGVTLFCPFPYERLAELIAPSVRNVVVIERSFAPGSGAPVTPHVRQAMLGSRARISTVVAGLGGRAIQLTALVELLSRAAGSTLPALTFLDLDVELVRQEDARQRPAAISVATDSAHSTDSTIPTKSVGASA
jgi:pyruvate ferredoxin oxidoreductase alpha subunit